jgi:exopolysaccharide production protein ExoQ
MFTRKSIEIAIFGVGAFVILGALQSVLASGADMAADGDRRYEAILALVYLSVFAIGFIHFRRTLYGVLRTPALVALLSLAFLSAAWAQHPMEVLRRTGGLAGATLFGVVLGCRLTPTEQLRMLRWIFRIAAAASLTFVIALPQHGIMSAVSPGAWRGVFEHKNGLGGAMALAILVEWLLPTQAILSKISKAVWLALYSLLLVFSDSVTAVIAIVLALAVLYAFRIFRRQYRLPLPALGLGALAVAGFFLANPDAITTAAGRSSDITGRTELWYWVVQMIRSRPWLGYGFSGFWRGGSSEYAYIERVIGWSPMYSHNGYLELLLSLGVAGLLLFSWLVVTGLRRAVKQANEAESSADLWPLAFILYFLFHNLGECTILWQNCLEWSLCVAVVVGAEARLRVPYESEVPEPGAAFDPVTEYV